MNIYTKLNPPIGFYTYAYLRDDGSPYYIGKGLGTRAWKHHTRKNGSDLRPVDDAYIVIVAHRLEEHEAHQLECKLILEYGRKDNNTGILRNLTDGGDGSSGKIVSPEQRLKMRDRMLGTKLGPHTDRQNAEKSVRQKGKPAKNKGIPHASSTKLKISKSLTGLVRGPQSQARRELSSISLKGRRQATLTCPHCNKSGGISAMKRHHFDNCKSVK